MNPRTFNPDDLLTNMSSIAGKQKVTISTDPKDRRIAELEAKLGKKPKVTTQSISTDPRDRRIAELEDKLAQVLGEGSSTEFRACIPYAKPPEIDSDVGQLIYHGSLTLAKAATAMATIAHGCSQLAEAADEGHKTYQSGRVIISPMIENTKSLKWRGDEDL